MSESPNEREARLGRNESVFRTVNDQIESLNQTFASGGSFEFGIVCECGDMTCAEQIQIPSADYARVRADETMFLLVAGHENPAVERVVDSNAAYIVVRKPSGTPAEIAANAADPPA